MKKEKFVSEPLEEVIYMEDGDGMMVPLFRSSVKTLRLAGGNLAFMKVEEPGQESHAIVFGWKQRDELLSSGFVKTYVELLPDTHSEIFRQLIETELGCPAIVW